MLRSGTGSQHSSRSSYLPSASGTSSASESSSHAKLDDKKRELAALIALDNATHGFRERVEAHATQHSIAAEGVDALADVLAAWQQMFHIVGTFIEAQESSRQRDAAGEPPQLVRLDLESIPTANGANK
ncbi:hypothetical protein BKA62DRAFT_774311 [Auriculariales sp. MPI-PUGE-AT-0066]|nr:hypothetical protein BKA62DRAFT_774311 [Auriculariales sp. MPI-PUGE-AT-0066]